MTSHSNSNDHSVDPSRVLNLADLVAGSKDFTPLEMPGFAKNGSPGILLLRRMSAGAMVRFSETVDRTQATFALIAETIVNPDGSRMFNIDQVEELRDLLTIESFSLLARAVSNIATGHAVDYVEPKETEPVELSGESAAEVKDPNAHAPTPLSILTAPAGSDLPTV